MMRPSDRDTSSAAATEKAEFAENGLHLGALALEILLQLGTVEIHLGPEMTLEIRLPFLALGRRREHGLPERDLGGTEFRRTARAAPRPDNAVDRLFDPGRRRLIGSGQARRRGNGDRAEPVGLEF